MTSGTAGANTNPLLFRIRDAHHVRIRVLLVYLRLPARFERFFRASSKTDLQIERREDFRERLDRRVPDASFELDQDTRADADESGVLGLGSSGDLAHRPHGLGE